MMPRRVYRHRIGKAVTSMYTMKLNNEIHSRRKRSVSVSQPLETTQVSTQALRIRQHMINRMGDLRTRTPLAA